MGGKMGSTGSTLPVMTPEQFYTEAERLRVQVGDFEMAGRYYLGCATMINGDSSAPARNLRFRCMHDLLICNTRTGNHEGATAAFTDALRFCDSDFDRGRLLRDFAEAECKWGDFVDAYINIAEAIRLLPAENYPSEHWVTIGFRGRITMAEGKYSQATTDLYEADTKLHSLNMDFWSHGDRNPDDGNCYYELYNKLHLIYCASRAGIRSRVRRRRLNREAYVLARNFGTPKHRVRAFLLKWGGWRADNLGQKLAPTVELIVHFLRDVANQRMSA